MKPNFYKRLKKISSWVSMRKSKPSRLGKNIFLDDLLEAERRHHLNKFELSPVLKKNLINFLDLIRVKELELRKTFSEWNRKEERIVNLKNSIVFFKEKINKFISNTGLGNNVKKVLFEKFSEIKFSELGEFKSSLEKLDVFNSELRDLFQKLENTWFELVDLETDLPLLKKEFSSSERNHFLKLVEFREKLLNAKSVEEIESILNSAKKYLDSRVEKKKPFKPSAFLSFPGL